MTLQKPQNTSDRIHVSNVSVRVSYKIFTNTLAVVQEGAKATAVQVIQDCYEKMFVELKRCRKLQEEQKSLICHMHFIKAHTAKAS